MIIFHQGKVLFDLFFKESIFQYPLDLKLLQEIHPTEFIIPVHTNWISVVKEMKDTKTNQLSNKVTLTNLEVNAFGISKDECLYIYGRNIEQDNALVKLELPFNLSMLFYASSPTVEYIFNQKIIPVYSNQAMSIEEIVQDLMINSCFTYRYSNGFIFNIKDLAKKNILEFNKFQYIPSKRIEWNIDDLELI